MDGGQAMNPAPTSWTTTLKDGAKLTLFKFLNNLFTAITVTVVLAVAVYLYVNYIQPKDEGETHSYSGGVSQTTYTPSEELNAFRKEVSDILREYDALSKQQFAGQGSIRPKEEVKSQESGGNPIPAKYRPNLKRYLGEIQKGMRSPSKGRQPGGSGTTAVERVTR